MCSVCNGFPGCPCCSDELPTEECSECYREGTIYYNMETEKQIKLSEYQSHPESERDNETCSKCHGEGYLIIENEY